MKELPSAEVYEQEFLYTPWENLIEEVANLIIEIAPQDGKVIDLMCGPGWLLRKIARRRPDLCLIGVDINEQFIVHAKKRLRNAEFQTGDVLTWETQEKYDIVLCTGGIHHLPYEKQAIFIRKTQMLLRSSGTVIFADPMIDDFHDEKERQLAAAKLGWQYLSAVIKKQASEEIIKACIDILSNDVLGYEFKTSLIKIQPLYKQVFSQVRTKKVWPKRQSDYGDFYFVCKPKQEKT